MKGELVLPIKSMNVISSASSSRPSFFAGLLASLLSYAPWSNPFIAFIWATDCACSFFSVLNHDCRWPGFPKPRYISRLAVHRSPRQNFLFSALPLWQLYRHLQCPLHWESPHFKVKVGERSTHSGIAPGSPPRFLALAPIFHGAQHTFILLFHLVLVLIIFFCSFWPWRL